MNFWRQTTHIMSYFKEESLHRTKDRPTNFLEGFLEVHIHRPRWPQRASLTSHSGSQLELAQTGRVVSQDHMYIRKLTFPEKEQIQ